MTELAHEPTLAALATRFPSATTVFHRHQLDFCCKGRRPLREACAEKGLDAGAVLAEIDAAEASRHQPVERWDERPLDELILHLVGHYHERLRVELPQLIEMAAKVEAVHADKEHCPRGLAAHLQDIHVAVLEHLAKEEEILFPMVLAGHGARAHGPVHCLESEHDDHGENLQRTRELTGDLTPPPNACTTWRSLYLRLEALEAELHEHIHLENNVLFPRALCR